MTTTYTLTRVFDGDDSPYGSTSFTTNEVDAINAAHMLAAGFNTMSRNFLNGAVLAVVYSDGRVQFDGRAEQLAKPDPWSVSQSFNFEGSTAGDTLLTIFGLDEQTTYSVRGEVKFHDDPEPSKYAHIAREVLEDAYEEIGNVKAALETVGVETIPPSAGVRDLIRRNDFEYSARTAYEQRQNEANEAARAEMISFVKRAHAKKVKLQTAVPDGDGRPELDDRWRGMLDVLAKFLVVTGEADADEGHAVVRRLCGIDEEMS